MLGMGIKNIFLQCHSWLRSTNGLAVALDVSFYQMQPFSTCWDWFASVRTVWYYDFILSFLLSYNALPLKAILRTLNQRSGKEQKLLKRHSTCWDMSTGCLNCDACALPLGYSHLERNRPISITLSCIIWTNSFFLGISYDQVLDKFVWVQLNVNKA